MVITKSGAIITLPNIYGRDFLQKLVNYFRQKDTIIDVRQSPKYASVWKKIWFLIKMEFDNTKYLWIDTWPNKQRDIKTINSLMTEVFVI